MRRTEVTRMFEATKAIALCHNVTPIVEKDAVLVSFAFIHFVRLYDNVLWFIVGFES